MKNIPESIFLQFGDVEDDIDYNDLVGVTFHSERVHKNDIEYIHADVVKAIIKRVVDKAEISIDDIT